MTLNPHDMRMRFNEALRSVPVNPAAMRAGVAWLEERCTTARDHSAIGYYLAVLGDLAAGEARLRIALFGRDHDDVAKIRLGTVLHWQRRYAEANELFESAAFGARRDFALQHHGKSLTDEGRCAEAIPLLEEALELRRRRGDAELIASSEAALARARAGIRGSL